MKNIIYFLFFILFGYCAVGQGTFQERFGSNFHDSGNSVIQTNDGNYLVVGYTVGFGSGGNALLIKVDQSGNIIWVKDYAGINADVINDVIELQDSSLVLVGTTGSYGAGSYDGFILKTDSNGEYLWAKSYGDIGEEQFYQIEDDGNNGFYVLCGGYFSPNYIAAVIHYDGGGSVLWARNNNNWSPTSGGTLGLSIEALSSGGVLLANSCCGPLAMEVYKYNAAGNLQWSNKYTPTPQFSGLGGLCLLEAPTGDIYVNYAFANQNTVAQSVDNSLIKLKPNGDFIWNKSYGGTYSDYSKSVINTNDDNLLLAGYSNSAGNGELDANLIKIDTSGALIWSMNYGLVWSEYVNGCTQTNNGDYLVTGQQWSVGYEYDSSKVYLLKTDSLGSTDCNGVAWTPNVGFQSVNIGTANWPPLYTMTESQTMTWNANLRSLNTYDNCAPLGISELSNEIDFVIYPNPTSDVINIKSNLDYGNTQLVITDLMGKPILTSLLKDQFDVADLASGYYLVSLKQDDEIISTTRLIKK